MVNKLPIPSQISEKLAEAARPLDALGLDEVAWNKRSALAILAQLGGSSVAVLGGDVYRTVAGRLAPAYESWFCERKAQEALLSYAERSRRQALSFIDSFPDLDSEELLFALVFGDEETAGL